jgi:transcription elongation factor GreA
VREKEVAELIKEARSFGDLSENSEYDEAKEQQGKLFSREAEVEAILENYELIDEGAGFDGTVNIGTTVKVLDPELDMEQELRIVGSQEADPMEGRISDESPLGKALMGKSVGDVVEVEAPAGVVEYRILDIYMS